jgi:hypothetical protein
MQPIWIVLYDIACWSEREWRTLTKHARSIRLADLVNREPARRPTRRLLLDLLLDSAGTPRDERTRTDTHGYADLVMYEQLAI